MDRPSNLNSSSRRTRLAMAGTMLLLAAVVQGLPLMRGFERATYDRRVQLVSGRDEPVSDIVVVQVDDQSLQELDADLRHWPWPRFLQGRIIEYLSAAEVTGVDVLYPATPIIAAGDPQNDLTLARAVAASSNVILTACFSDEYSDLAPPDAFARMDVSADEDDVQGLPERHHALTPEPALLEACRGLGMVRLQRDEDGTIRSYFALERFHGHVYPSLALAVAARFLGVEADEIKFEDGRVRVGTRTLPLADDGSFLLVPHHKTYQQISAMDIISSRQAEHDGLEPEIPREFFRDKIVLVGITASGVREAAMTPMVETSHNVMVHADAIDNLIRGISFRMPPPATGWALMLFLGIVPAAIRVDRPRYLILLGLGLLAAFLVPAVLLAMRARIMVPIMGPTLAVGFTCTGLGFLSWTQERAFRRHLETLELAKQQFTDMLVHDLRNTVTPIVMSLTLVGMGKRKDGTPNPTHEDFLHEDFPEIVSTSTNKLMSQINALLDIRRIQEGRMQLHPRPGSLRSLLERADEEYRVPVSRAGLRLEVEETAGGCAQIMVDAAVCDRILGNVIWNAVKYAAASSVIRMGSRDPGEGCACIYVANQGAVIPDEVKSALFSAFMTGPDAEPVRGRIPSSGLGLTFCKLAMEAHRGAIDVASPIPGQNDGVEVRLTFPIHPGGSTVES